MSRRIRVLCAIGSLDIGGAERQMIQILRYLDRQRFEPLLYLTHNRGDLRAQIPDDVPVHSFWEHRQFPRFNYPGRLYRAQIADLAQVIAQQQIDVVYDRTFTMTLFAGPASDRAQKPRVSCIASDPKVDLPPSAGRFLRIKRRKLAQAYRSAFQVVTVSDGVRQSALDYYQLAPSQVTTILNGVDLQQVEQRSTEFTPDFPADRFHIVACGRLHPSKGYPHLMDAVATLGQHKQLVTLHILGEGSERARLEKQIEQLSQQPTFADFVEIKLHGYVENPLPYIRAANLFCLSSVYEGLPNALLEAIACGTPVVATDCDFGPREILSGGRYGHLVTPPDTLQAALLDAIQHPERDRERTVPARKSLAENYSLKRCISQLEDLLEAAVHQTDPVHSQ